MKNKSNLKIKGKKKLTEMSVDEFMEHGLDSDISSAEEEEIDEIAKPKATNASIKSETKMNEKKTKSHKKQLDHLKERDPEFFKFLQENDEGLLEFSGSESEEDDGVSKKERTDDDCEEDNLHEDDQKDPSDDDDDDGDDDNDDKRNEEEMILVTSEMIADWKKGLEAESLKTLKEVMSAFHASVVAMTPEDSKETVKKSKFVAKEGTTFNSLATLCLKHTIKILDKHVKYQKEKKSKLPMLPSSSKDWRKVKEAMKQYLYDMLQLLRQLADPSMLTIILRHCQILTPFYACFPKVAKMFLKRTVRMWSSSEEHVKVLAFLCIRKCVSLSPNLYEFTLKKLYLAFVQNSKFVSVQSKPILVFMQNSLVELFSMNEVIAYQHAFVYIRQLAIHLRNAITIKKKDSLQAVYNWQFLSSLQLWSRVVGELYGETLKPLVYPIVQITLGVSRLIPSARYYPIRFQCIEILNYLSKKTGVYIPVASNVVEIFESNEFIKKPKSTEKIPNLQVVLKVSKQQVSAKGYQDFVIDIAFESLLEHYVVFSSSIAFPELIFPICHRLKRLMKNSKVPKLSKDMKTLVEKLQKHGDDVTKIRSRVTFSPKDLEQVNQWEEEQKSKKSTLDQFYETWKRMNAVTTQKLDKIDSNENKSGDTQLDDKKKKLNRKRKKEQNDEMKTSKTTQPLVKKAKKTKVKIQNGGEDIVEEFKFSDDDAND